MSDTKTFIVPDGNNCLGGNNLAAMALMNGNGGFGGNGLWNNPFMYLVWMWMMRWMNNGWDQNGDPAVQRQLQTLQESMQDNHNSDLIMAGINGNTDAIREFASNTGCNFNAVQSAIQGVQSSICEVGSKLGFSAERIINAVNQGDCGVIQAIKDCCCNTQKAIIEQGYQNQLANERQTYQLSNNINTVNSSVERGFRASSYETLAQTCALQNALRDTSNASTTQIIAKLDQMQNLALMDKIDALREKNSQQAVIINNAQQSSLFGQMINLATAPIQQSISSLAKEVGEIQCKLPNTVTLPYSCATAVPTSIAAQYGLYGLGAYGAWG